MEKTYISVVIPIFNEEENIGFVVKETDSVLKSIEGRYEIIVVDDGSNDKSVTALDKLSNEYPNLLVLKHKINKGKSAALNTGFSAVEGDIVVMMDGDRQFTAKDIPKFIAKFDEGYDVVNGWGEKKEPLGKKIPSKLFNIVSRRLWGLGLRQFNLGYKAFKKEYIKDLRLRGGDHRILLPILAGTGCSIGEIKVEYFPRVSGTTKFGSSRLLSGILDMIALKLELLFSEKPLRVFGLIGVLMFSVGFFLGIYLFYLKFFNGDLLSDHIPLMFLVVLCWLVGLNFLSFGFLAEISKPPRRISETL